MVFTEELATQRQAAALQRLGLVGLGRIVALDEHDRQVVDALGDVGVKLRIERLAQGQRLAEEDLGGGELALLLEYRGEGVGALGDIGASVAGQRAAETRAPPRRARVRGRAGRGCRAGGRARESSAAWSSGRSTSSRRTEASLRSRNSPRVVVSRSASSSA